jgi:hypothetical protein
MLEYEKHCLGYALIYAKMSVRLIYANCLFVSLIINNKLNVNIYIYSHFST